MNKNFPKVRVRMKKTGLIYTVTSDQFLEDGRLDINMPEPDKDGGRIWRERILSPAEFEVIARTDWTAMLYQYAGMAMQALISSGRVRSGYTELTEEAVAYATALVDKLQSRE